MVGFSTAVVLAARAANLFSPLAKLEGIWFEE
jgi:hypothetical protein